MEGSFEDQILLEFLEEAELQQYHKLFRESLKVSKLSQLKYVFSEDLAQIGLSKPEQRRFKKIYSKYFPNQYISRIKNLFLPNRRHELHNHGPSSLPTDLHLLSESTVHVPSKHIIPKDDITINKELGMGQFGVVQQGTWTTGNQRIQVAIKCLGHERMTSDSTEFLKEAAVMHGIEHPFIVRLYGVVLDVESLMLVTELAPLRSLLECLREVSLRPHFPVSTLCEFAEQICSGMTYLEQKRLIHRDLAARNILVFNKDRVKISDFGLSRALGVGKDYYQTNYNVNLKLPVAWCAPECILYLRFTTSSDVWAYGVCLWEMFTYGFQPWVALTGQQILEAIDSPNCQRLERPELCPEQYYIVMLHCWEHDPTHRPKFSQLLVKLQSIRPEQVQATQNFHKPDENRLRISYLEYKTGQTITVLGKNHNNTSLWYGVLAGGACGLFDPACTKPIVPKGAAKPPRQVVPPYQPCKELDQQPLINPHSPSFLTGAVSMPPYPLLDAEATADDASSGAPYQPCKELDQQQLINPHSPSFLTGAVSMPPYPLLDPEATADDASSGAPYQPCKELDQQPLINPHSPSFLTGAVSMPPYPLLDAEATADAFLTNTDSKTRIAAFLTRMAAFLTRSAAFLTNTDGKTRIAAFLTNTDGKTRIAAFLSNTDGKTRIAAFLTRIAAFLSNTDGKTRIAAFLSNTDGKTRIAAFLTRIAAFLSNTDVKTRIAAFLTRIAAFLIRIAAFLSNTDGKTRIAAFLTRIAAFLSNTDGKTRIAAFLTRIAAFLTRIAAFLTNTDDASSGAPYQPCKELDQQPLINPHSPSFLTGAVSMPPYPLLDAEATADVSATASTSAAEMCSKSSRKNGKENIVSSGKGILNKVLPSLGSDGHV
ncbi:unnamed protein product [Plutella xylostella]|uniref:non-specific protein-tyrosine kinase n=1 Tax=Plutella xylostella TaxID=51655 RepID=A0A8S4GF08_PLUXY|nr:unnamed protein product [Plutella xylostella]